MMPSHRERFSTGEYRHLVTLENPGNPIPDGDGGFTEGYAPLTPPVMWASIAPATATDLEHNAAGTVLSTASHIIRMAFHPEVTTETRITYASHVYQVTGYHNDELRDLELVITAEEVLGG